MSTDDPTRNDTPAEDEVQPESPAVPEADADASTEPEAPVEGEQQEEQPERIELDVEIEDAGPCKKNVRISIPRESVDDRLDKALDDLVDDAQVPGFRPGHAPRRLVQRRFRREMSTQVRGELVAGSIEQVIKEHDLIPMSMPDIDMDSVEMPDDGPMTFELILDVRPQFDVPEYKGMKIKRLTVEVADEDVERALDGARQRFGRLVPKEEGACAEGDYAVCDITFRHGDEEVAKLEGATLPVTAETMTRYAMIKKLDEALIGAEPGQTRPCEAELNDQFEREELRGETAQCEVTLQELKQLELPELTDEFVKEHLDMESVDEVRDRMRQSLEARVAQQQDELSRQQVTQQLLAQAEWELPEDMVAKQTQDVQRRMEVDMMFQGVSAEQVRDRRDELAVASQQRAEGQLKQFFLLDKIAEAESIKVDEADVERHIAAMAANAGENPRRVRARLEKERRLEMLEIQIREMKTIEKILEYAEFEDVTPEQLEAERKDDDVPSDESADEPAEEAGADETAAEPAGDEGIDEAGDPDATQTKES